MSDAPAPLVVEYCDFLGRLTGFPVSPVIVDRFATKNKDGFYPGWSYEEIERLHLLSIAANRHRELATHSKVDDEEDHV